MYSETKFQSIRISPWTPL